MKKLLIVDTNSILNRAFYGIRPLSNAEGLPTNAVYGLITILKKHLDSLNPDMVACAFDLKAPTFRHKMYSGYKANRKPMPEDLAKQLPIAKEVVKALGFKVIECEGWEADDILGTLAGMGDKSEDTESYILTGDRDSLQLLTEHTSVILVKTKEDILFTPKLFLETYGVTPMQYIDVKALMGDSSDNIPGVAGIGEKTAFKLISECGSLDELYADENLGGAGKSAKEKLISGKDSAYMSYDLAKISREAPIGVTLSDLENKGIIKEELSRLFVKLEFSALAKRFDLSKEDENSADATDENYDAVALTDDSILIGKEYSVTVEDGKVYIFSSDKLYFTPIENSSKIFENFVICHDYKKLCTELSPLGIHPKCTFDTLTAAYLLSPGESNYPIDRTVMRYLSVNPAVYPGSDAVHSAKLFPVLKELIEKSGMNELMQNIELQLSPVLAEMEEAGFTLDTVGLREYLSQLSALKEQLAIRIYTFAGREFNINSTKQLGEVLFDDLGLPVKKKTKTGYSTDAETLEALRGKHDIIDDILDYRQVTKLVSTYGENLIEMCDENSRIHTVFNQTGTATGRLSSLEPNLQNIPVRAELGRELRRFFTASDDEHVLIDADYSQIELRLVAEISGDKNMCDAYLNGKDIHTSTAAKVFGISENEVTKELRSHAKAVNFGIIYGIGAFSLSKDINVSLKAAKEYIENYLKEFPGVDAYLKNTVSDAKLTGYTTTLFGRRRPIPELKSSNKNLNAFGERVAMNSPIQGTAADIIKLAMINTRNALKSANIDAKLILQVHDELLVEASKKDADLAAIILKREMENAVKTTVPLEAAVSIGDNWFDAK